LTKDVVALAEIDSHAQWVPKLESICQQIEDFELSAVTESELANAEA